MGFEVHDVKSFDIIDTTTGKVVLHGRMEQINFLTDKPKPWYKRFVDYLHRIFGRSK